MLFCEYFAGDIYILSIQLLSSILVNLSVCTKPFSFPNAWKVMLLMFGIFSFQWISIFRSNGKYEIFLTHLSKQIFYSQTINWKKTAANNHFNNSILSWRHKCLRQSLSKNIIYHTKDVTAVLLKTRITIFCLCGSIYCEMKYLINNKHGKSQIRV